MFNKLLSTISSVKPICDIAKKVISNNFHIVEIDNMISDSVLGKIFPNIPMQLHINTDAIDDNNTFDIGYDTTATKSNISRITIYKGIPIWLDINQMERDSISYTRVYLRTLSNQHCISILNQFIQKVIIKTTKHNEHEWGKFARYKLGIGFKFIPTTKFRDMDTVFIPSKDKELIKTSIDKFVNNRSWYIKNNIQYHFGILLYGVPSSGKTILAQAIAKYINASTFVIPGDSIMELPDIITNVLYRVPSDKSFNCVIVEDIDCGFKKRKKQDDSDKDDGEDREKGFASILNCLDGINAPSNVIYIFTTNHIDQLDPALIRPGRCDLLINVGYITKETFDEFCQFHYGDYHHEDFDIRDDLTFASLQTEIMKGISLDDLCKFVQKKEGDE